MAFLGGYLAGHRSSNGHASGSVLLTLTGTLLMFYYRPTLEWAYNDILALRDVTRDRKSVV